VAKALTSPQGLSTWLCDEATVEARANGALRLSWHEGRRRDGLWTHYEVPSVLAWRWREGLDGPVTAVRVTLAPEEGATRLRLTEEGVAAAAAEATQAAWRGWLSDLAVYVVRGANARFEPRPMLGVSVSEVDAEMAKERNLPVSRGILLDSLTPESAAVQAGLRSGDLVVGIGEQTVEDWGSLVAAMGAHRAGDTVNVTYWRDGRAAVAMVTLAGRPAQAVPESAAAFHEHIRAHTAALLGRIEAITRDLDPALADYRPGAGEWSLRQVLAHLSYSERHHHEWLALLATDGPDTSWHGPAGDLRQAVIAELDAAALVARYAADLAESEALMHAIVDRHETPPVWYQLAASLHFGQQHLEEHLEQLQALVTAGRAAAEPA
jgi:hypothetical protein